MSHMCHTTVTYLSYSYVSVILSMSKNNNITTYTSVQMTQYKLFLRKIKKTSLNSGKIKQLTLESR